MPKKVPEETFRSILGTVAPFSRGAPKSFPLAKGLLGEPDPFRFRYRDQIASVIKTVVQSEMDKKKAHAFVESQKVIVALEDQKKFIEVVEIELMCLHEGNVARFKINLKEYEKWSAVWK